MSKTYALAVAAACGLSSSAFAEIRLLTGGTGQFPHLRDSPLMDISADGNKVLFVTGVAVQGTSPGITQGGLHIRTLSTDTLQYVGDASIAGSQVQATMSDDGRYITWSTNNSQIYWRDTQTGTTRLASSPNGTTPGGAGSANPIMSGDGRYVAFISLARNLIADTSKLPAVNRMAVYIYDSQTQTVSIGSLGNGGAALTTGVGYTSANTGEFDFSADGRFIVFSTESAGMHADTTSGNAGYFNLYRRNLSTGAIDVVNRNASGQVAKGSYTTPKVSADGGRVIFTLSPSYASLGTSIVASPSLTTYEMYVKDLSGPVWHATKPTSGNSQNGIGLGGLVAINGNGSVVAFASTASNLVAENTDAPNAVNTTSFDIFRVDLGSGGATTTTLISKSPTAAGNVDYHSGPLLPGTGNYVAFNTSQVNQMLGVSNSTFGFHHGFGVGTLPAVVAGPLTFTSWASSLPVGQRDYDDNPAGDGVKNLIKYFMGMEAAVRDTSKLPVMATRTGASLGIAGSTDNYLTLQFRVRRSVPAGFTWVACASNDVAGLATDTGSAVQVGAPVADGDFDVYLFRYPTPMTSARGFMTVRFVGP